MHGTETKASHPGPYGIPHRDSAQLPSSPVAQFAVEVAAVGGHHMLVVGNDLDTSAQVATAVVGILPDLTADEAAEASTARHEAGITRPPFEAPHRTTTLAGLLGGGGTTQRPGAVARAHSGVLLLGDAPEFDRRVFESLRQPLEYGVLVLFRAAGVVRFPARFQLVLTAASCPCKGIVPCTCTPVQRHRYLGRLSGPVLDRIDITINLDDATGNTIATQVSADAPARVAKARQVSLARLAGTPWTRNVQVPAQWIRQELRGDRTVLEPVDAALDAGLLSVRGADRTLRLALSVADLAGHHTPTRQDVEQALALRTSRSTRVTTLTHGGAR